MIATTILVLALAAPPATTLAATPALTPPAAPTAASVTAEYAAKPGAVKTASGLVYVPVRVGTGPSPVATSKVKVNYEGKLPDGKVFDSSYQRGQAITFPLNGVIKCWTEGVQKMKVGGEATLVCPPSIAYGDRGAGGVIPPGATLIFRVELLDMTP